MIYCFLNDTAAYRRASGGVSEHVSIDQGAMLLDDQMVNYFNTPMLIADPRTKRLMYSDGNAETGISGLPDGRMSIHFDKDQLGGVDLSKCTTTELGKLFNIIELLVTSQNRTAATLNALMSSNSDYSIYSDSPICQISGTTVELIPANGGGYWLQNNVSASGHMRTWVEFAVEMGGQYMQFHIWAGRSGFMADYPWCTITDIWYPCDPNTIRTLTDYNNVAKLLQDASSFNMRLANTAVAGKDHTGVASFSSRYQNSVLSNTGNFRFYFGVVYKGRTPTNEEMRAAVKEDILEKTGTVSQDWEYVLPDLFTKAAFFLVPLWDNYSKTGANETIKHAIYPHRKFAEVLKKVYKTNIGSSSIDSNAEVIDCPASEVLLAAIASPDNASAYTSLSALHPTYMGVTDDDPDFVKQDAVTRLFSEGLNKTMTELLRIGMNTHVDATEFFSDKLLHLTFSAEGVDYHVLLKRSYPTT